MEPIIEDKPNIQKIIISIKKKDAIIFCRVSSIGQTGAMCVSFEVQEQKGNACANLFKLKVYSIIKVVESAYQGNQKSSTIKNLISKNRGKNIIIYNVTRFCRNKEMGVNLLYYALRNDVRLFFVQEGIVWDRENQNIKALKRHLEFAEEESRQLGKRIKDALDLKKKNGYFVGGKPKYGFRIVSYPEGRKTVFDEYEQEVIKFINMCKTVGTNILDLNNQMQKISKEFDEPILIFYNGEPTIYLKEPLSHTNIADLLNGYGILRREGEWTASSVGEISRREYNDVVENVQTVDIGGFTL